MFGQMRSRSHSDKPSGPSRPMTLKENLQVVAIGLLGIGTLVGGLGFFLPWAREHDRMEPVRAALAENGFDRNAQHIAVESSDCHDYFNGPAIGRYCNKVCDTFSIAATPGKPSGEVKVCRDKPKYTVTSSPSPSGRGSG